MRYTREAKYDGIVNAEATAQGVPVAFVKAIIGAESAFVETARRPEPQLNDASWGLMQLLYRTARGLGYTGTPDGLLDPGTNIHYGVSLLASNLARSGGDLEGAASAYNGGWRPSLGFGRKTVAQVTVCLAHDPATGQCIRSRTVPPGEFANQDYVNRVLSNYRYFVASVAPPPPADTGGGSAGPSGFTLAPASILGGRMALPLLLLTLVGLLAMRQRGR